MLGVHRAVLLCGLLIVVACSSGSPEPDDTNAANDQTESPLAFELVQSSPDEATSMSVPVTVELTNRTDDVITVVRPFVTPNFVLFTATDSGGEPLLFLGPALVLAPLTDEDFVELDPGNSVSHDFDIAEYFDLPPGTYTIMAAYRNPPEGSHEGGRAFTARAAEAIVSTSLTIEVRS